jgi:L-cysteine/cystine lyase
MDDASRPGGVFEPLRVRAPIEVAAAPANSRATWQTCSVGREQIGARMNEHDHVARLRRQLPATLHAAYFNTGTCGPLPTATFRAMQEAARLDYEQGRIGTAAMERHAEFRTAARSAFARLVHADAEDIALTHHTGEGLNIVLAGFTWQAGDEIITSDSEHSSLQLPLTVLSRRYGVVVREVAAHGDAAAAVRAAITSRTRLVALSHVSYATGVQLPLAAIVEAAHTRQIPVLVDAAQSAGAIPLNLPELGVDYYAMPGQKWLCGPEGTGALYVRRGRCDELANTFVGYYSVMAGAETFQPHPGARRFEVGGQNLVDLAGIHASLSWLEDTVGLDFAYARTANLAAAARERLASCPGLTVLTPAPAAGLVSFTVDGVPPADVVKTLAADQIIIRSVAKPACCRVATGFYNTEDELDRLATALSHLAGTSRR